MPDQQLHPQPARFDYVNYKGVRSHRHVLPLTIWYGTTEYHPSEAWFVRAWDFDRSAIRDFALRDISNWRHAVGPARADQALSTSDGGSRT